MPRKKKKNKGEKDHVDVKEITGTEHAPQLPPGWVKSWSPRRSIFYYFNTETGARQWNPPKLKDEVFTSPKGQTSRTSSFKFHSPPTASSTTSKKSASKTQPTSPQRPQRPQPYQTTKAKSDDSKKSSSSKSRSGDFTPVSDKSFPEKHVKVKLSSPRSVLSDIDQPGCSGVNKKTTANPSSKSQSVLDKINKLSNKLFKKSRSKNVKPGTDSVKLSECVQATQPSKDITHHLPTTESHHAGKLKAKNITHCTTPYQRTSSKKNSPCSVKLLKSNQTTAEGESNPSSLGSTTRGAINLDYPGIFKSPKGSSPVTHYERLCENNFSSGTMATEEVDMDTTEYEMSSMIQEVRNEQSTSTPMQSEGDLTKTFLDSPKTHQHEPETVFIVVDTNILLSDLDQVKRLVNLHDKNMKKRVLVVLPWVVMQELDALKQDRQGRSEVCCAKARQAVRFLNDRLESGCSTLRGQSPKEAKQQLDDLVIECNDDKVLQCCLQFKSINTDGLVLLLTLDTQLRSKAVVLGLKVLPRKTDIVAWLKGSSATKDGAASAISCKAAASNTSNSPAPDELSEEAWKEASTRCRDEILDRENEAEIQLCQRMRQICDEVIQSCLGLCLRTEMIAVYEELWEQVVFKKPPWTPQCILLSMNKHWMAVFGFVLDRSLEKTCKSLVNSYQQYKNTNCLKKQETIMNGTKKLCQGLYKKPRYRDEVKSGVARLDAVYQDVIEFPYSLHSSTVMAVFQCTWDAILFYGEEFGRSLTQEPPTSLDTFHLFVAFLLSVNHIHIHFARLMVNQPGESADEERFLDNLCHSLWLFAKKSKHKELATMPTHYLKAVYYNEEDIGLLKNGLAQLESMMVSISQLKSFFTQDQLVFIQNALNQQAH